MQTTARTTRQLISAFSNKASCDLNYKTFYMHASTMQQKIGLHCKQQHEPQETIHQDCERYFFFQQTVYKYKFNYVIIIRDYCSKANRIRTKSTKQVINLKPSIWDITTIVIVTIIVNIKKLGRINHVIYVDSAAIV